MLYHTNIYRYSIDPYPTIKQLKEQEPHIENQHQVQINKLEEWMYSNQIKAIMQDDIQYSHHRKRIKQSPYILYYTWNLDLLYRYKIGIVGSRNASTYGTQIVTDLIQQLQGTDIVTISWGAEWIDTLCHNLSMQYQIPTICVLWWWLGYYLTQSKRHQIKAIVDAWWLVVSEFRLKEKPAPRTFPQRNRIIAGLSDALVVACAALKSGSLITAQDAYDMQVPVYAAPWSIYDPTHTGINDAITQWIIKPFTDITWLLTSLKISNTTKNPSLTEESLLESEILVNLLSHIGYQTEMSIGALADASKITMMELQCHLSELEIEWYIIESKPWFWIRQK